MSDLTPFTGCVNWQAYDTNAIWQVVRDEDEHAGFKGVVSWNAVTSHLEMQEERLRRARETLAAAWPPESNASALAFHEDIERMLRSIADTRGAAARIMSGLDGLVSGLAEVKRDVRTQLADRLTASKDLKPRFLDHAEDEIDARVRQLMMHKEQAFADHASQITPPDPFVIGIPYHGGDLGPTSPPGTDSDSWGDGAQLSRSGGGVQPVPVEVPHDPPAPRPGHDPFALPGHGVAPADRSPGSPGFPPRDGNLGGGVDGPGLTGARGGPGRTSDSYIFGQQPGGAGDSFLPGLVAGGMGTAAAASLFDRPGAAALPGTPQQVGMRTGMPSGTVIGGQAAGRAGTGSGAVPGGMPGMHGGSRSRQGDQDEPMDLDPTNVWETDEGVVPVIGPDERVFRHDAGPGVIGWDR